MKASMMVGERRGERSLHVFMCACVSVGVAGAAEKRAAALRSCIRPPSRAPAMLAERGRHVRVKQGVAASVRSVVG